MCISVCGCVCCDVTSKDMAAGRQSAKLKQADRSTRIDMVSALFRPRQQLAWPGPRPGHLIRHRVLDVPIADSGVKI